MKKFKNTKFMRHKQATTPFRIIICAVFLISVIYAAEGVERKTALTIAKDGTIDDMTIQEGLDVSFSCNVTGDPEAIVFWQRAHGELITLRSPNGPQTFKVKAYRRPLMTLVEVDREQAGDYLCVGYNEVSSVNKSITLTVNFAPKVLEKTQFIYMRNSKYIQISCRTEANPPADVEWVKNGVKIVSGSKFKTHTEKVAKYQLRYTLLVLSYTEDDLGIYTCSFDNDIGKDEGFVHVNGTIRKHNIKEDTSDYVLADFSKGKTGFTTSFYKHAFIIIIVLLFFINQKRFIMSSKQSTIPIK